MRGHHGLLRWGSRHGALVGMASSFAGHGTVPWWAWLEPRATRLTRVLRPARARGSTAHRCGVHGIVLCRARHRAERETAETNPFHVLLAHEAGDSRDFWHDARNDPRPQRDEDALLHPERQSGYDRVRGQR